MRYSVGNVKRYSTTLFHTGFIFSRHRASSILTLQGCSVMSPAILQWAEAIEVDARDRAGSTSTNEVKDSIHVKVVEIEPHKFEVEARAKEDGVPFIAEATRDKLREMPITSRSIFKVFLEQIDKKLGAKPEQ